MINNSIFASYPYPDHKAYQLNSCGSNCSFQTAVAGSYYLANGSGYRNYGNTSGVDPTTLAYVQSMTTCPPLQVTGVITSNVTYSPQPIRDTNGLGLGFHYYPLDYVFTNLSLNANATLTLTNGVAVGVVQGNGGYATNGLDVNGTLTSQGAPNHMNHLASVQVVQEEPAMNLGLLLGRNGTWQKLSLRFTDLPSVAGTTCFLNVSDMSGYGQSATNAGPVTIRDCRLSAGSISMDLGNNSDPDITTSETLNLSNNVMERCSMNLLRSANQNGNGDYTPANPVFNSYNNLFWHGSLNVVFNMASFESASSPLPWAVYDNLFQSVNFSETGTDFINGTTWPTLMANGHNGYVSSTAWLASSGGDKTPPVADFEAGALEIIIIPPTAVIWPP